MEKPASLFRINQVGYAAGLPVRAVSLAEGTVRLTDANGRVVRTLSSRPAFDQASGDHAALLDFGPLPAGTYRLEGGGDSRILTVSATPWRAVTDSLIKGLYYQRCGCALLPEHAGSYVHAACHTAMATDWEDRSVRRDAAGGWHDAGDYGKYVAPGAVTVAHLLYAWKLFPAGCGDDLGIPETGSGVPDILSEARWELTWLLKMQRADGAFHHKLTKAHFAPFIMPECDTDPEYLMPASSCATGSACACLALACRVYRAFDPVFADRMLEAAKAAWVWLEANPDCEPFRNPEGVRTGQYGDRSDRDERFWAACELLAATGNPEYRRRAEQLCEGQRLTAYGWADVGGLGGICCLFDLGPAAGDVLYTGLKETFLAQSEEALEAARASGYGTALRPDGYVWGSILPVMSGAMAMILNHLLTGRPDMREAALDQLHYALGMNAPDRCFVTGQGEKPVMHPHHRPSGADGIEAAVPGLIAGGPNQRFPYPMTREKLPEGTPPAKCYLDETFSADTNEIAIYWNSPAIFTAAYFNMLTLNREQEENT